MENQKETQKIGEYLHLVLRPENRLEIYFREESKEQYEKAVLTEISFEKFYFQTNLSVNSLANLSLILSDKFFIPARVESVEFREGVSYVKTSRRELNDLERKIFNLIEKKNLAQQDYIPPESVRELEKQLEIKPPKEKPVEIIEEKSLSSEEEFKEHVLKILSKTNKSEEIVDKIGVETKGKFYIRQNIFPVLEAIDDVFNLQKSLADKFSFPNESERKEAYKKIHELWKKERKSYKNVYDPLYDEDQKGLEDYLSLDVEIKEFEIDFSPGYEVIEGLGGFLKQTPFENFLDNIKLILGEGVENAIEHSRKDPVKEKERIRISYGYDNKKIAISVIDFYGTLENEKVEFHKNLTEEYLLDLSKEGGKGIYLMNLLADKLEYNIKKGKFTQLIAVCTGKK